MTQIKNHAIVKWKVGVDGCKTGWFYVGYNGKSYKYGVAANIKQLYSVLCNGNQRVEEVLIDIPIGLNEGGRKERTCDLEARKLLRPRGSSIFPAPIRPCLNAKNYSEACDISFKLSGKKISKQTYYIIPKILEIDEAINENVLIKNSLKETHPELVFSVLNGNPLRSSKKGSVGRSERLELLERVVPFSSEVFHEAEASFLRKEVALDDIIDALACLSVALSAPKSRFEIPQTSEFDSLKIKIAMHLNQSQGSVL